MLKAIIITLALVAFVWGTMWLFKKLVPGLRRINGANQNTRKTKKQKRSNVLQRTNEAVGVRTARPGRPFR